MKQWFEKNESMKVVSFFAGCGGLDLGFEQAGFNVVWANELEPHCKRTYLRNHPHTELIIGDINSLSPSRLPDCDGFIGGPPCQSWSVGGKQKGLDDSRGRLFIKYLDLIREKSPKFFLIENVKGILDSKFENIFNDFLSHLADSGYDVNWQLMNAVNFKIPQNRERIFIIGFRKDLNIHYEFPSPNSFEPVTLEEAIGDITDLPVPYIGGKNKVCPNYDRANHDVLESKFGPFYYRGNRRRGWQQPSFTINATAEFAPLHPSSPKMLYFGHENWNFQRDKMNLYRRLSVRECARIQSFPDNFIFEYDDIHDAYRMIGNAVPPRLAFVLAKSILSAFSGQTATRKEISNIPNSEGDNVLVGYYKNRSHRDLILKNQLYYIRSDGRNGSISKDDCRQIPQYLLLHNKDCNEVFMLDGEEPVLATSEYLRTLGFKPNGKLYLCFRLIADKVKFGYKDGCVKFDYDKSNYNPYITSLNKILIKQ